MKLKDQFVHRPPRINHKRDLVVRRCDFNYPIGAKCDGNQFSTALNNNPWMSGPADIRESSRDLWIEVSFYD